MPEDAPVRDDLQPPRAKAGDAAHVLAKAAISAVPYVGGPAAELFGALLVPPLTRRRDEWMKSVAEAIEELRGQHGRLVENLQKDEAFVTTVMQATQVALRSHEQQKLDALRNAVLNAGLRDPPEDSLQQVFLNLVDTLTVWHLRVLKLFHDPPAWFREGGKTPPQVYAGGLVSVLEAAFPELAARRHFYAKVWSDLFRHGLTNTDGLHATMTPQGLMQSRTTEVGNQFLAFISRPKHRGGENA